MSASTAHRLVAWHGPDPDRVDAAVVKLGVDRLEAHGSSACADYVLTYRLTTVERWVTRQLDVRVEGPDWWRTLSLRRDDEGDWTAERYESIGAGPTLGGPETLVGLGSALDCDLGLCPMTNTMPVLREGLVAAEGGGQAKRVTFTMAWVGVPDLRVRASQQVYEVVELVPGLGARITYTSGDFQAQILFDHDGIVVDYPELGSQIQL